MFRQIHDILNEYSLNIRDLGLYINEIHLRLEDLDKQTKKVDKIVSSDKSFAAEPHSGVDENGKEVIFSGLEDNIYAREAISFANNNRKKQLRDFLHLSLTTGLTHFIAIFEAKFLEMVEIYYLKYPTEVPSDTTLDKKMMKFAFKPLSVIYPKNSYDYSCSFII